MRKIPTLFARDPETNLRHVKDVVHPDCQWVVDGEGVPTRKYDGTCVMFDGTAWWARRDVKPDKATPANFVPVEFDEVTGKTVGWEPADQSGFARWLTEAIEGKGDGVDEPEPGTYELLGPKINGNPEGYEFHTLLRHDLATQFCDVPTDFADLGAWLHERPFEGVVWHHPDGRMAKIKRKDFPTP